MAGEQIRLLVVEDVPQVASHVRSLLQAQSQIKMLDVVTSGDRAAGSVAELRPDVVIVDALLQGRVNGQQVAEQIRRAEPSVGIIMLTVPQNPVREDASRGIDAVLKMPFTGFDLTTLIRKVGETRAVESAKAGSLVVSLFSPKGGVGRTTVIRCRSTLQDDGWHVRPTRSQESHILSSMLGVDALALVPEDREGIAAGEPVEIEFVG